MNWELIPVNQDGRDIDVTSELLAARIEWPRIRMRSRVQVKILR